MPKFFIEFYETPNGRQPAKDFLLSLDSKMRVKMTHMLDLLQNNGYELGEPYTKHLSDGIFELRGKLGNNLTRLLFFYYRDHIIILTNGFIKKTQKTPRKELEKAKKYRSDYLTRKGASK